MAREIVRLQGVIFTTPFLIKGFSMVAHLGESLEIL